MFDFDTLYRDLKGSELEPWLNDLPKQLEQVFEEKTHGFLADWIALLADMPKSTPADVDFNAGRVRIGCAEDMDSADAEMLEQQLRTIIPWRKGPYELFGIHINTEWRSDFKWDRIQPHLAPLKGRTILDVGCGNGYHMWRMLGEGADLVIGADPSQFFLAQFRAIKQYAGEDLHPEIAHCGLVRGFGSSTQDQEDRADSRDFPEHKQRHQIASESCGHSCASISQCHTVLQAVIGMQRINRVQ